ncbi:MAG: hypothetical protein HRT41_06295 [Campylobacteraceae bacterium]|nr:hypothetical protein [Campylobacteraceae bacterium]
MTQVEISKYLEIPLTTLNDWKKEDSNRNKLYQLLIHLDKKELQNISEKKVTHRFFHILNRNIDEHFKFTYSDIKKAFNKSKYDDASIKEQSIYSKFFKELSPDELEEFISTFDISKRDVKNIYITSPFRSLTGVAKSWDKRFRLKHLPLNGDNENIVPLALQNILKRKKIVHV